MTTWTQVLPQTIGLPMTGQQTVPQNAQTQVVTLTSTIAGNYDVWITPNWNTTWWVTAKTANNFTVAFGTAPDVQASIDWRVEVSP